MSTCVQSFIVWLRSNSSVKEFVLDLVLFGSMRHAANAVKGLLEHTSSKESFKLLAFVGDKEDFLVITQGLINSESVTDITFNF
jgi:hypothetical protein